MIKILISRLDLLHIGNNKEALNELIYKKASEQISPLLDFSLCRPTRIEEYDNEIYIFVEIISPVQLTWRF